MNRERLDLLVVQRGLAESREKAQRLILAGQVLVEGEPHTKPGHTVPVHAVVSLKAAERFVSRGGEKLEGAFLEFHLNVEGKICADIGSSTGGFTDCLLQHGASKVYAVDVGKGQLHWKLRQDPRVVSLEDVNARYLSADQFPDRPQFAAVDVSFISLTKVLPSVVSVLEPGSGLVALIKPQFEAGREQVGKGGVVRDPAVHDAVIAAVRQFGTDELGLAWQGVCRSPLTGPAGNIEFLSYWRTSGEKPGRTT